MTTILLTNDDGIHAPGLKVLAERISTLGDLWVIAPHIERSACGRSVTLHRPLRAHPLSDRKIAVDGTPVDCVLLAFRSLLKKPPDVVISGINRGFNIGEDVDYSGTVAAAAEGCLQGAKLSLAASLCQKGDHLAQEKAADYLAEFINQYMTYSIPLNCFININFPTMPTNNARWTKLADFLGRGQVQSRTDPRGRTYYWIAERPEKNLSPPDTDRGTVQSGIISVSLLSLDRSYHNPWDRPTLCFADYHEVSS